MKNKTPELNVPEFFVDEYFDCNLTAAKVKKCEK